MVSNQSLQPQDSAMNFGSKDYILTEDGDFATIDSVVGQFYTRINMIKNTCYWDRSQGSVINQQNRKYVKTVISNVNNSVKNDVIAPILALGLIKSDYTLSVVSITDNGIGFELTAYQTAGDDIKFSFSIV